MRLFLGIELPSGLARRLVAAARERWPGDGVDGAPPRWAAPEDLHLTLRFLGEPEAAAGGPGAPEQQLVAATERLAARAAGLAPAGLDLGLTRLGCFPRPGPKARVLWAGPDEVPAAWVRLAAAAEDEARGLGFPPESHPFRPHVTLLRPRPREAAAASALVDEPLAGLELTAVRSIALLSNRGALEGSPPRYRVECRHSW